MAEPAGGPSGEGRTLLLLRHGRTRYNHEGRAQGQLDVDLDDEGRAQAKRAADAIARHDPALLWSSDLVRARGTAEAVAAATGLDVVTDRRLREFDLGEREGLTFAEYAVVAPEEHRLFRQGRYDAVLGGEGQAEVADRMTAVLREALAATPEGRTGVVVSHGGVIRVAVGALLGWPADLFLTLRGLANCGWVTLAEHPETGVLRLAAYNRTAAP